MKCKECNIELESNECPKCGGKGILETIATKVTKDKAKILRVDVDGDGIPDVTIKQKIKGKKK